MSIEKMISRNCPQTAVYWGTPVNDGQGGKTYADPVEIDCRWELNQQLFTGDEGESVLSIAIIYPTQDVDNNGMIFLGDLDDLTAAEEADPSSVEEAYTIRGFAKIPTLTSTTEFLRKAYLTPWVRR